MFNLKKAITVLLGATTLMTGTAGMAAAQPTDSAPGAKGKAVTEARPMSFHQAIGKLSSREPDSGVTRMSASDRTFDCVFPFVFQAAETGKYVSAEFGYWGGGYAMLRARADGIGDWETFSLCKNVDNGFYSLQSNASGKWVTAELTYTDGDYGMLRATASWVGDWEQFQIIQGVHGGYALQSVGNGLYVSAELDYWWSSWAMLRARSNFVGRWETFN